MLPVRLLAYAVLAVAVVGCNAGGGGAGPEADSGKNYTIEDANSAQPKRGPAINEDDSR